jgi:hypothetical protein
MAPNSGRIQNFATWQADRRAKIRAQPKPWFGESRSRKGAQSKRKELVMRIILATAAALLVASAAFAQSPTGAGNRGTQDAAPNSGQSATQGQNQQSPMDHQSMGAQIQKNLQAAGFTDVQIMPSSFLVRAKDRDGNPVMMVINPDSVTAVTKMGGSQSQPNQGSTTGSGSPNQNPNNQVR